MHRLSIEVGTETRCQRVYYVPDFLVKPTTTADDPDTTEYVRAQIDESKVTTGRITETT